MHSKRLHSFVPSILLGVLALAALSACGGPVGEPVPASPQNVTATPGPGYVTVAWEHEGEDVTGFRILRSDGDTAEVRVQASTEVAEVGSDSRMHVDTSADIEGTYTYAVEAVGPGGASEAAGNDGGPVAMLAACMDPAAEVHVADAALRGAIRDQLALPGGSAITCGDMAQLTELEANEAGIASLAGLQYATNIEFLSLHDNAITDLRPLARLTGLGGLNLDVNPLASLEPLAGLTELGYLSLGETGTSDLSALAGLTNLTLLYIWSNDVSDLTPLADLLSLEVLYASWNEVADLSVLAGFTNLRELHLAGEDHTFTDVGPIAGLTGLEVLNLDWRGLGDGVWTHMEGMTGLVEVFLSGNDLTDASAAASFNHLELLAISENQITDIDFVAGMTTLRDLVVSWNPIADPTPALSLTQLETLNVSGLAIADIAPLENFTSLRWLGLDWNEVTSIAPLVANAGLGAGDWVGMEHNFLDLDDPSVQADIRTLLDRGVELVYEPQGH